MRANNKRRIPIPLVRIFILSGLRFNIYFLTTFLIVPVYISILIAAPLILMMMLIVMNVAGLGMGGLSITSLLMISVAGIGFANIVFLVVLNAKQPKV